MGHSLGKQEVGQVQGVKPEDQGARARWEEAAAADEGTCDESLLVLLLAIMKAFSI